MDVFSGFPNGNLTATAIPAIFFAQVLPRIESIAELQVTLHVFWRTSPGPKKPILLTLDELLREPLLIAPLANEPGGAQSAIRRGVRAAIQRGTFIELITRLPDADQVQVGMNTERVRKAVAENREGSISEPSRAGALKYEATPEANRPAIFGLYEANIGLIQPILADELRRAGELFPNEWIEQAFREAVRYNKRNWRYIKRILERWAIEGRDGSATPRGRVTGSEDSTNKREWVQTYRPGDKLPDL